MPPPPAGHPGAGGGRSGRDRSASGCDRSPHPDPLGLGLGSQSSPVAEPSGGRCSPSPLGVGDDDRSSAVDSLNIDREDSFRAVLHLIREFHGLEELASVDPNQCKTSLAPVYRLQSESSSALHLPTCFSLRTQLCIVQVCGRPNCPWFPSCFWSSASAVLSDLLLLFFPVRTRSRPVWPRSPSRR